MDKIDKFLKKISQKDCEKIDNLVSKIIDRDFTGLNYKKLKGYSNIFRVRKGDFRVTFTVDENDTVDIISIGRKQEDTYKLK
jgi:mRNA-degrading endonuclease RelE of RelBE toxin-antitoxin system